MSKLRPGVPGLALEDPTRPACSQLLRDRARSGSATGHRPPPVATSSMAGWRSRAGRIEPLAMGRLLENTVSQFSSLWRRFLRVRKSSRRSLGRPRLRGGDGGGGGVPAESARGAEVAQWPAGVKRSPKPGDTTGSFPETPRRRCSGWSRSCPGHCLHCPGRCPPSVVARRSPRRLAPRPAGRHKVAKRWLQGAARWGSHRFSTSS